MRSGLGNNFDQLSRVQFGAWTPSSWADLVAHFARDYGVDSDAVGTPAVATDGIHRWYAQNDAGIYIEQTSGTLKPTLTDDSGVLRPRFDGAGDYMSGTLSALQTSTFAMGFRYVASGGSAYKILGCLGASGVSIGHLVWLGQHNDNAIGGSNNFASTDIKGGANDTSKHTLIAVRTPTTFEIFLDNVSLGSVATSGTATSGIVIGGYRDFSLTANADINDIVVGDADIGSDRTNLHTYLYGRA